jgi:hypothetical protein
VRGEIFLVADSVASVGQPLFRVAAHQLAESWDPATANWQFRREGEPWTQPGGTLGAEIGSTPYSPGDTIRINVDSATLAAWRDTTDATRGAVLTLLDGPSRLRSTVPRLRVYARSSWNPDTLFSVISQAPDTRYVYDPPADSVASDIRYNGTPAWRSFLHFEGDLGDRAMPCGTGCSVPLRDAAITSAELVLQPRTPPPGFTPELPTAPLAFSALVTADIPLARTPLGVAINASVPTLTVDSYRDDADPISIDITRFVRQLVSDTTSDFSTGRSEWLAIIAGAPQTFGFARFAPGPRLRLVLSTPREVQLP